VKFDLPRIGLYFAISLTLYLASREIHIDSYPLLLVVKNGLILMFAVAVFLIEKPSFAILKKN
ncbi:MAG TPA: hypothetical protein VNY36_05310, partial [Bacteroidia bacterium]|nr:hypothetical protein [Bacteroidia bacterium]